ncbi:MAG: CoA-transferase [Actinomycetota bacterium]
MEAGIRPLFMPPDADGARQFFRQKPKRRVEKVMTVSEAVAKFVHDGDYVGIGGFGANRIPTAPLHEIVRQGRRHLGISCHTATHDFQVLVAGDCIDRCDMAYAIGIEIRGLSPAGRRLFEEGRVKATEWTNAALAWRYKAAAMGLPFIPARVMLGTDTFRYSAAKVIKCPFTGAKLLALPALSPDIAIIHVHRADPYGNCQIDGNNFADADLARAAKHVIVTTERLVPTEEIRRSPHRTSIPFLCVDAVCEVPYGSYPGNMAYEYYSDEDHIRAWLTAEQDLATYREFVDRHIYKTRDFNEYLEECGGIERLRHLRAVEFMLERPDFK